MKRRWIALTLAAVMAIGSAAGCSSGAATGGTAGSQTSGSSSESTVGGTGDGGEKVIRYATSSSPSGIFMPLYHNDTYNGYITSNVFEGLTQVNPEGVTEGRLAKSWDVSEDGKTYTFHLNEGITWHDGEPFTVNDVAFTYNFMAQPGYTGYDSAYIGEIVGYEEVQDGTAETLSGVQVIDENTISITTKEVYSSLLNRIGGIEIIPEHIWGDVDVATADEQTELIRNPVGTGPFKLNPEQGEGEFVQDQYVALVANKDYWQGAPKIDELIYVTVNADTAQAQMLNGELDVLGLNSINDDDIALYESEGFVMSYIEQNSYQCMQINQLKEEFQDPQIRQAITYAINRAGMVESLLYGHGEVSNTIYRSTYWAYPGDDACTIYEYNPEKAVEIFESLGYTYDADANVMYDPSGEPVSWDLYVPTGNEVREQSGTIIQANLGDIGISCNLETMEFATLISLLQETDDPERFDLALTGYGMGADPDISTLVTSTGANNYSMFSSTVIDDLCAAALAEPDEETRTEIYHELASAVSEELPVVYLYHTDGANVLSPSIHILENAYWSAYNSYLWTVE